MTISKPETKNDYADVVLDNKEVEVLGTLKPAEETPEGFLKVELYVTRSGIFIYKDSEGKPIRALRKPHTLQKVETLDSLKGKPFTLLHPTTELVNPENASREAKGSILESIEYEEHDVETGDGRIKASAILYDKELISAIKDGQLEVSAGMLVKVVDAPKGATYNGEEYDVEHIDVRFNHVSSVPKGRAGPSVRLRLDEDDDNNGVKHIMQKIQIKGLEYELDTQAARAVLDMEKAHKEDMGEKEKEMDAKDEVIKQLRSKVDMLEKKMADMMKEKEHDAGHEEDEEKKEDSYHMENDAAMDWFQERSGLLALCDQYDVTLSDARLSNDVLRKEILQASYPDIALDGKNDQQVKWMFEGLMIGLQKSSKSTESNQRVADALTPEVEVRDGAISVLSDELASAEAEMIKNSYGKGE